MQPPYRLSPYFLLSLFGIIPAIFLFMALDFLFTDFRLSRSLVLTPQKTLLLSLVMQAPHNMASMLTFCDREYLQAYKPRLAKALILLLVTLTLPWVIGDGLLSFWLVTYTFFHQSSQQAGVAAMLARNRTLSHEVWRWASFAILMAVFVGATGEKLPVIRLWLDQHGAGFQQGVAGALIAYTLLSAWVAQQSKTGVGKAYVAANSLMFLAFYLFFRLNLSFFMLLVLVFVHDLTAFAFYINHNMNRNAEQRINLVSRLRNVVAVPEYILTPVISMTGAILLYMTLGTSFFVYAALLLNIAHFHVEGFMWKSGAPHRQNVRVSALSSTA